MTGITQNLVKILGTSQHVDAAHLTEPSWVHEHGLMRNVFVPFQDLVTITNMAVDVSQQPDPTRKSFCKNVVWEDHNLGAVGKDVPLRNLKIQEPPFSFLSFELCVCLGVGWGGRVVFQSTGLNFYSQFLRV